MAFSNNESYEEIIKNEMDGFLLPFRNSISREVLIVLEDET